MYKKHKSLVRCAAPFYLATGSATTGADARGLKPFTSRPRMPFEPTFFISGRETPLPLFMTGGLILRLLPPVGATELDVAAPDERFDVVRFEESSG